MKNFGFHLKRVLLGVPLAVVAGASFMPLRAWAQQALVLLTLVWYFAMLFTEVLGK
jgi:hypothetical protein